MRRRRRTLDNSAALGEAISFEDILTIITVLLLLRIIFMVPLVNLDKAKTVTAKTDLYWSQEAVHILSHASDDSAAVQPYRAAFGLGDAKALFTRLGDTIYIEAAQADSNLLILRHLPDAASFVALRVQGQGHTHSFRRGRVLWSQDEGEWFVGADTVDYGSSPESKAMEAAFRQWTKRTRGY